jgi:hypothetical protein
MPELTAKIKRTSVLRRVPNLAGAQWSATRGYEGDVCVFSLEKDRGPITLENEHGRIMTAIAGDMVLATPGFRQPRREAFGSVPDGGLEPGAAYWALSKSGVIGEHVKPEQPGDLIYRGTVQARMARQHPALWLICTAAWTTTGVPLSGACTCNDVGKTTSVAALVYGLQINARKVIALKATGTGRFEPPPYRFWAAQALTVSISACRHIRSAARISRISWRPKSITVWRNRLMQ